MMDRDNQFNREPPATPSVAVTPMERVLQEKNDPEADKPDTWQILRGLVAHPFAPAHLPFIFSGSGILLVLLLAVSGMLSETETPPPVRVSNVNQQFSPAERASAKVITNSTPLLRSDSNKFKPQINYLEAKIAILENQINRLKEELETTRTSDQALSRRLVAIETSFSTITASINRQGVNSSVKKSKRVQGRAKPLPSLGALPPFGTTEKRLKSLTISNSPTQPSQTMFAIFLGSNNNRQALQNLREELRAKYASVLKDINIYMVGPKKGKKKFQLVAGPIKNMAGASTICVALKTDGKFCHQDIYSRTLLTDLN